MSNKKLIGYKPLPYQKEVNDFFKELIKKDGGVKNKKKNSSHTVVVLSPRQCGKTLLIINQLLYYALNYSTTNMVISPTLSQSRRIYNEILKAIQKAIPHFIEKANENNLELWLSNRAAKPEDLIESKIWFKSDEQRQAIRGYSVSGLLCFDESSFISDETFDLAYPFCDWNKSSVLVCSTPRFKKGRFFELFMSGQTGDENITTFNWANYDLSTVRSSEKMEQLKATVPPQIYKSEYLGQFLDADSSVFNNIEACIDNNPPSIEDATALYCGLDFGSGQNKDNTVLSVLNQDKKQVVIYATNFLTPSQQILWLTEIFQKYSNKIKVVNAEKNSIGAVYISELKTKNKNIKIREVTTTQQSKRKWVEKLQLAFENEDIGILNDQDQLNELAFFEQKISKNGEVSYSACYGMNDDRTMALLLAYDAMSAPTGQYNISFY